MDIITKRLRLTPIDLTYVKEVYDYFSYDVCTYMYPQPAASINDTIAFITDSMNKFKQHEEVVYAVLIQETNEFIGCIGVHKLTTSTPELGIWLKMSAHGFGYGQEGVRGAMDEALKHHLFDGFIYPVDRRNLPSRRIPEKMGAVIQKRYAIESHSGKKLEILEYYIPVNRMMSPNNQNPIIVFDGDSVTDANRDRNRLDSLGQGHAEVISRYFPDAVIFNRGISGHRSEELWERYDQTLSLHPDIICLLIGINDIWHFYRFNKPLKKNGYYHNLNRIILKTKKELPQTSIILLEPFAFPMGEFDPSWVKDLEHEQQTLKRLADKHQCRFIPIQTSLYCMAQSYAMAKILPDGVHPSEFGYQLLSQIIFSEISEAVRHFYHE